MLGHFHLQITATGGGNTVGSEDELFRKIPDVDFFDQLRTSTDTHVAIAIRGIGKMAAADVNHPTAHPSRVELDVRNDEYGVRRALVTLTASQCDNDLWTVMDATMAPTPPRFVLRLQWMMTAPDDNSGVFVAFPHPEQQGYDNTAYVGVNFGFEIQIDELARPDNAPIHRTSAIYFFKGPSDGPTDCATGRRMESVRDHGGRARLDGRVEWAGRQSLSLHR